ncbi:MAG TPA: flagellar hook-basal body complex protein FliE [Xanthobacteraceae bacterium]|nr:flagellar hook-basal body complex protein FliE [Xanthobacteraceae bacterium]
MPTPIAAAGAYAKLARLADPGAALSKTVDDGAGGPSFGALVKEALGAAVEAGRKSDTQAQAMAAGKTNMVDLVTAVAESETAITTLVSVRDRVIQAYQQIMQMPI